MISSTSTYLGTQKLKLFNKTEFGSWQKLLLYTCFPDKLFHNSISYLPLFWGDVEGEKVQESLKLGLGHTTSVPFALWGQKKLTCTTK